MMKPTVLNTAKPAKKLVAQLENDVIKALLVTSAFFGDKTAIGEHSRHAEGKGKGNLTKVTKPYLWVS